MHLQLDLKQSPTSVSEHRFSLRELVIGRGDACGLQIRGEGADLVSTRHARLYEDRGRAYVEDLSSTNGTYVGGEQLRSARPLSTGDEISFGRAGPRIVIRELSFLQPDEEPGATPTAFLNPKFGYAWAAILVLVSAAAWWFGTRSSSESPQVSLREVVSNPSSVTATPPVPPYPVASPSVASIQPALTTTFAVDQTPTTPPPMDWKAWLERHQGALVWVGADVTSDNKKATFRFVCGSGWAINSRRIITTAVNARLIEDVMQFAPYVVVGNDMEHRVRVRKCRYHAQYDAARPTAPASMHYNAALLELESPLPNVLPLAPALTTPSVDEAVRVAGYVCPRTGDDAEEQANIYDPNHPPELCTLPCTFRGSDPAVAMIAAPRSILQSSYMNGCDGAPVLDAHGRVAGIVSQVRSGERVYSISPQVLRELIASSQTSSTD